MTNIFIKYKWLFIFALALFVVMMGLLTGKFKDSERIAKMYERAGFTLLDDSGNFFSLKDLPEQKKLFLVITPDILPTSDAVPFYQFSQGLSKIQRQNIEVILLSRIHKDIVKNFKIATKFTGKILLDEGGSVGKLLGAWNGQDPTESWNYVLLDKKMQIYWSNTSRKVLSTDEILSHLPKQ